MNTAITVAIEKICSEGERCEIGGVIVFFSRGTPTHPPRHHIHSRHFKARHYNEFLNDVIKFAYRSNLFVVLFFSFIAKFFVLFKIYKHKVPYMMYSRSFIKHNFPIMSTDTKLLQNTYINRLSSTPCTKYHHTTELIISRSKTHRYFIIMVNIIFSYSNFFFV